MGTTPFTHQKPRHRIRRFIVRAVIFLVLVALVLVAVGGWWGYSRYRTSMPQLDGTIQVAGLGGRVKVKRDARGVPHLRAQLLEDLVFAQGYVTAQDRLWQMDLSRRLAFGNLSAIFGERLLPTDIENRTLGFHRVAVRAFAELDSDSQKLLTAYARGVNAFISTHSHRLPVEFLILHYEPSPWQEIDSFGVALNMAKTLNTTWPDELMRERVRTKVGDDLYPDLFPDRSPLDHPVAEFGTRPGPTLQARSGTSGALPEPKPTEASAPRTKLPGSRMIATARMAVRQELLRQVLQQLDPALAGLLPTSSGSPEGLGSNNWVVNGTHTQSGKPLLANDPHLAHSIPSVWYMTHLQAPGLNVSGVSLPGLPLIVIGHNEKIAWGMTNTAPDVQDLYTESFNFQEPNKYLHNGEWVDAEIREELIKVRDARDYHLTVKITRHGPVVSHAGDEDLALRWTALEPHGIRLPFLKIDRAQNWPEFTEALRDFTGPMQNFVYADLAGNIGFYAAGWVPIRALGDGTVPSIGSMDDNDWKGYIPFESLPHSYNPPSGIIATANGRIVPDNYPYLITHKWDGSFRTARIYQLLGAQNQFTVPDMLSIQSDIHTLQDEWLAKQLLLAAGAHTPASADAQYALTLLGTWDGEARVDSAATLVCEVTRQALLERVLRPKLGDDLSGYHWPMSPIFMQNVLTNKWTRWLPPGDADFNVTLMGSLEDGVRRIPPLVGSGDQCAWQWGKTIPLTFTHHLSNGLPSLVRRSINVGPVPQAGTGTTVKQTTVSIGPSMRMVVDFSDFDKSVQNITLGESGQVFSPYYKDQFNAWYTGQSFPMLFSDPAVESGTVHRLVLEPEGR